MPTVPIIVNVPTKMQLLRVRPNELEKIVALQHGVNRLAREKREGLAPHHCDQELFISSIEGAGYTTYAIGEDLEHIVAFARGYEKTILTPAQDQARSAMERKNNPADKTGRTRKNRYKNPDANDILEIVLFDVYLKGRGLGKILFDGIKAQGYGLIEVGYAVHEERRFLKRQGFTKGEGKTWEDIIYSWKNPKY